MSNIKDTIFSNKSIIVQGIVFLIFFVYFGLQTARSIENDIRTYNEFVINKNSYISFSRVVEILINCDGRTVKTMTIPVESVVKIILINDTYRRSGKILNITVVSPTYHENNKGEERF